MQRSVGSRMFTGYSELSNFLAWVRRYSRQKRMLLLSDRQLGSSQFLGLVSSWRPRSREATGHDNHLQKSILGGLRNVHDLNRLHRSLCSCELQTELFLNGSEDGGALRTRRKRLSFWGCSR